MHYTLCPTILDTVSEARQLQRVQRQAYQSAGGAQYHGAFVEESPEAV